MSRWHWYTPGSIGTPQLELPQPLFMVAPEVVGFAKILFDEELGCTNGNGTNGKGGTAGARHCPERFISSQEQGIIRRHSPCRGEVFNRYSVDMDQLQSAHPRIARSVAWPVVCDPLSSLRSLVQVGVEIVEGLSAATRGISEAGEIVDALNVPHDCQPFAPLHAQKINYAAVFSSFFHRVTGAQFPRELNDRLTAKTVALVWVSDYIIDDFGLPTELRIETLQSLAQTVRTGAVFEYDFCNELTALSKMTAGLHEDLRQAPRGDFVVEAIERLSHAAARQITERPSLELSEELGATSFECLASIPFAFDPRPPDRILVATRAMGAVMQLIDDVWDRERDRSFGNHTFASVEGDAGALKRVVGERISSLREEMVARLLPEEARQFKAILGLSIGFFAIKERVKSAWRGTPRGR